MEDTLRGQPWIFFFIWPLCLNPCFNGRYSQRRFLRTLPQRLRGLNPCFNGRYSQRNNFSVTGYICKDGLNPCFNGRYSQSTPCVRDKKQDGRLNPCFNGRYSQSMANSVNKKASVSLNPCFNGRYSQRNSVNKKASVNEVLILVLMEDTLRVADNWWRSVSLRCLNPCFNGRYSQRTMTQQH